MNSVDFWIHLCTMEILSQYNHILVVLYPFERGRNCFGCVLLFTWLQELMCAEIPEMMQKLCTRNERIPE